MRTHICETAQSGKMHPGRACFPVEILIYCLGLGCISFLSLLTDRRRKTFDAQKGKAESLDIS